MLVLSRDEIRFLFLLGSTSKLIQPFSVYRRLRLSPGKIVSIVNKLNERQLIDISDEGIKLTEEGKKQAIALRNQKRYQTTSKWREIPSQFQSNQLSKNIPYAPRLQHLDVKFFKIE